MAIKPGKYDRHGHDSVIFISGFYPKPVDSHEITIVHNNVAYHLSALEIVIDISVG